MDEADKKAGALRGARRSNKAAATRNMVAEAGDKVGDDIIQRQRTVDDLAQQIVDVVALDLASMVAEPDEIARVKARIAMAATNTLKRPLAARDAHVQQLKDQMFELCMQLDKMIALAESSDECVYMVKRTLATYRRDK